MEVTAKPTEVKVETIEVQQYERLVIEEEGDEITCGHNRGKGNETTYLQANKEDAEDTENEEGKNSNGKEEGRGGETAVKHIIQDAVLEKERQNKGEIEKDEGTEEGNQDQMRKDEGRLTEKMALDVQENEEMDAKENREEGTQTTEDIKEDNTSVTEREGSENGGRQQSTTKVKPEPQLLDPVSAEPKYRERLSPQDAQKQIRRLTPDFPDSLYELLCSLQEGRRLNDQRCSFTMERRCHSEPSTPVPRHRVVFSSMTSLQKEEFFEFVATSQGRRLDDQRAELQDIPAPQPPAQPKAAERKISLKGLESRRPVPRPAPKEELYNMILTSQAQGRLEEQRSPAPGPMDDEDFFSLLLRVQGGRLDEQRTELPITLRD
ncbi:hypothetical protein JZ751_009809 [Albula glossodonta]|uniref:Uncharacterized protein n=1 Tax=Albula glossodonta TaxID=121402 RepID=A0A8T2NWB0_9TELE|nr:hypothetical protein JZ751_009809 [Albula glossodonta]